MLLIANSCWIFGKVEGIWLLSNTTCYQERTMPILCVCERIGGKGRSFTDSRAIWIVLINLPTFYQEFSFLTDINEAFLLLTRCFCLPHTPVGTPSVAPYFLTLQHFYWKENAIYSLIKRNPISAEAQAERPFFLFNRIIAKRIILHCLLNTQAEIMTWTQ